MEKRVIIEFSVLFFLMLLMIIPGMMFVDVLAHEFYHFSRHKDVTEEICLDVNKPYQGHVSLSLPTKRIDLKYTNDAINEEERKANKFGKIASIFYLVNIIVVFNWIFLIMWRKING